MPNIILIGFMGTGKTTVGKRVARLLGMEFIDTDQEVEKVTGLEVKEIFRMYGETRFRSEEVAAVRRLACYDNKVISTGGGIVLAPGNMEALGQNGIIIALEANAAVILDRVGKKNTRPLLQQGNAIETIERLLKEREAFYRKAAHTIETSELTLEEVVQKVIEIYHQEVK